MLSHVLSSRRTFFILLSGILTGFLCTNFIENLYQDKDEEVTTQYTQFIPKSPHSHGETDHFAAPDQEQIWSEQETHQHNDNSTVADELFSKVRVLCWVMTAPQNLQSKARHVKATWGKRCNKLLFMSSQDDPSLPAVGLHVPEGRDNLWGKTKRAFKYVYDNHFHEADWFLKADDDTYVVMENLRHLLSLYRPSEPIYFGRRFKPYVRQGYMSGGAGYVLSKEALYRFVTQSLTGKKSCRRSDGGAEDLEIGQCLMNVGVQAGDSRDELGKETFHPFIPEHHTVPNVLPQDMWYFQYNFYPTQQGPGCCSDVTVSFHYVPPNMMYVFEYFIYHLKPYGLHTNLALPAGYRQLLSNSGKTGQPSTAVNVHNTRTTTSRPRVKHKGGEGKFNS